ncbi:XylR N-terminal domain-containing protein [Brevibacillus sp. 179-C 1.1 NHS]|uniref:XylR N-terminal domain-containing protein n=1 Tax=Brevibacillus sp. 179-C 1.1 NHS TaxID=3235177 RepID=UPI0039A34F68
MANQKLLYDHLTVSEKNGAIYMNDERMIVISASAFGTLRKDLLANLGLERMKGFLIRYGWDLAVKDAQKAMEMKLSSIEEIASTGPALHMIKGHAQVHTEYLKVKRAPDQTVESIHMEGSWRNSYEAEEHVSRFGLSESPVCYTLIGYASGYLSTICNHMVIFKEISCEAVGHEECRWVGKSLALWNGEVNDLLQYFEDKPIVKELEMTYESLLEERNNLSRTSTIHKKLTEEIINGNDLQSIADVVFDTTSLPLIIENANFRTFAHSGLSQEEFTIVDDDFKTFLRNNKKLIHPQKVHHYESFSFTKKVMAGKHSRLITPIILRKKVIGYCSFIYPEGVDQCPEIDSIILERIATVSSLYLLNEKTSFEAEERMKGHFLEQVLQGQLTSKQEILKRGSFLGLDLDQPYYIMALHYQQIQGQSDNELLIHEEVLETIHSYVKEKNLKALVGNLAGNIVLLIQSDLIGFNDITAFHESFIHYLRKSHKRCTFQMGISSKAEHMDAASVYYEEAIIALRLTTPTNKNVVMFDSLGVVGLFINSQNESALKRNAQKLLGPLYNMGSTKHSDLLKTLYVFLENGGNLEQTATDLSLSMSGLRYRIQKIETMLGQDLRNPAVNYQLFLTLQVLIISGEVMM